MEISDLQGPLRSTTFNEKFASLLWKHLYKYFIRSDFEKEKNSRKKLIFVNFTDLRNL